MKARVSHSGGGAPTRRIRLQPEGSVEQEQNGTKWLMKDEAGGLLSFATGASTGLSDRVSAVGRASAVWCGAILTAAHKSLVAVTARRYGICRWAPDNPAVCNGEVLDHYFQVHVFDLQPCRAELPTLALLLSVHLRGMRRLDAGYDLFLALRGGVQRV
jgi:hypothetical protein